MNAFLILYIISFVLAHIPLYKKRLKVDLLQRVSVGKKYRKIYKTLKMMPQFTAKPLQLLAFILFYPSKSSKYKTCSG